MKGICESEKKPQTSENKPSKICVKRTLHTWVHKNAHARGNKCIIVLPQIGTADKVFGYLSYWLLPLYSKWFCLISLQISLKDQVHNISLQLLSSGIGLSPLEEGNTAQIMKEEVSVDRHCHHLECHAKEHDMVELSWPLFCYQPAFQHFWSTTGTQISPGPSTMSYQHPNMCSSEWSLLSVETGNQNMTVNIKYSRSFSSLWE